MKKQALAAALLLSASAIQAQNNTWQAPEGTSSLWEQFLDNLSDYDDIEAGSTEEMYEELRELEATPMTSTTPRTTASNGWSSSATRNVRNLPNTSTATALSAP